LFALLLKMNYFPNCCCGNICFDTVWLNPELPVTVATWVGWSAAWPETKI